MSDNGITAGGLGPRIAERRAALGLTREALAERAGVPVAYVECLEEPEVAARLVRALDTMAEELGAGPRKPELVRLDESACLRLISPGGVGRIGFNGRFGPTVLPVNYRMHDGALVFRTVAGSATDEDLRTGLRGVEYQVAFEVDRIDDLTRTGWSVLVRGSLHHVTEDDSAAAASAEVEPWAGGDRRQYLRITPSHVTGRRIVTA
ncbi:pyridoxamine 5'-phosphate oxidase family protein [Nonomuraea sp. NPDC048916]|uniref:helix-turn-helix domain-containing protein n=1 Tax=Nonomuraea sp. NPDC048916 TaxID=3154232 RepID=UPI0033D4EEE5